MRRWCSLTKNAVLNSIHSNLWPCFAENIWKHYILKSGSKVFNPNRSLWCPNFDQFSPNSHPPKKKLDFFPMSVMFWRCEKSGFPRSLSVWPVRLTARCGAALAASISMEEMMINMDQPWGFGAPYFETRFHIDVPCFRHFKTTSSILIHVYVYNHMHSFRIRMSIYIYISMYCLFIMFLIYVFFVVLVFNYVIWFIHFWWGWRWREISYILYGYGILILGVGLLASAHSLHGSPLLSWWSSSSPGMRWSCDLGPERLHRTMELDTGPMKIYRKPWFLIW